MIYTICLTPSIEKRVRGTNVDEIRFNAEQFSYNVSGTGIKVSNYLKHFGIDTTCVYLSGSKTSAFIEEELTKKEIKTISVESNVVSVMQTIFIDENENVQTTKEPLQIVSDAHLSLFQSVLENKIEEKATIVMEYNDMALSKEAMSAFYKQLAKKAELLICDIHPKYYEVLAQRKVDVLTMDETSFLTYMNEESVPLSKTMEIIQEELTPLAQIIIYMYAPNDFLIFYNKRIYRVLSTIKLASKKIYKEAVLAKLLQCLENDDNFETMCKECLKSSMGANLSDGLFITTELALEKMDNSVHVYSI